MAEKIKVHSLTGRIDDWLMRQSFLAVKRNRGAAGIDKVSIGMFQENLDADLASLQRDLKTKGSFVPTPLFHDCSFGFRPKRSCHQAIERLLSFHEEGERINPVATTAR